MRTLSLRLSDDLRGAGKCRGEDDEDKITEIHLG
jgi:hypothetical protein